MLVYFGLGVASRAVSLARDALGWDVPVLANSALMFGYARPDWRDGYAGWEYIDTIADDNRVRAALRERSTRAGGRPDRLRRVRHGPPARRGRRPVGAPDPRRHRRRAAPGQVRCPAASGYDGTLMGFGTWDHAALKGHYLVLREWKDGRSVQVDRAR